MSSRHNHKKTNHIVPKSHSVMVRFLFRVFVYIFREHVFSIAKSLAINSLRDQFLLFAISRWIRLMIIPGSTNHACACNKQSLQQTKSDNQGACPQRQAPWFHKWSWPVTWYCLQKRLKNLAFSTNTFNQASLNLADSRYTKDYTIWRLLTRRESRNPLKSLEPAWGIEPPTNWLRIINKTTSPSPFWC